MAEAVASRERPSLKASSGRPIVFGTVIARIAEGGYTTLLRRFGVPDVCVPHATIPEQRELYGLTAENILSECRVILPVRAHTA